MLPGAPDRPPTPIHHTPCKILLQINQTESLAPRVLSTHFQVYPSEMRFLPCVGPAHQHRDHSHVQWPLLLLRPALCIAIRNHRYSILCLFCVELLHTNLHCLPPVSTTTSVVYSFCSFLMLTIPGTVSRVDARESNSKPGNSL